MKDPTPAKGSLAEHKRRESPAGYHYYFAYLENPRNWFIKYVLGLKPRFTAPPLIRGGAMHEARARYFETWDVDAMLSTYREDMTTRQAEYASPEEFSADLENGQTMLQAWSFDLGPTYKDLWKPVLIEEPFAFGIGPSGQFTFTVRPDSVCQNQETGRYAVFDMKTTGWSIDKTISQAASEDQLTSYIWAMRKARPDWNVREGYIDVIFARKNRGGLGVPVCQISDPIYRTDLDLAIFEMNIVGIIAEVSQKVLAYHDGMPWPLLFPRNGRVAGLFEDPYKDIARLDIRPGEVPPGFVRDEWVDPTKDLVSLGGSVDWKKFFTGPQPGKYLGGKDV